MDNKNNSSISGTESTYRLHHHNKRGKDQADSIKPVFGDSRGDFLKNNIGTNKKVLDIGCRDGALTSTYSKGNNVLGLDIDSHSLQIAKNNLNIEIKQTDLNGDWNVSKDHYDFVVAGEILEHLYYPEEVIKKIRDALKKDGTLLGSVPNAFSLKNRIRLFFGNKKNTPLADKTHINHFTRKELKDLLEKYFNDVEIIPFGRFTSIDKLWPGMLSFMLIFKASNKK